MFCKKIAHHAVNVLHACHAYVPVFGYPSHSACRFRLLRLRHGPGEKAAHVPTPVAANLLARKSGEGPTDWAGSENFARGY